MPVPVSAGGVSMVTGGVAISAMEDRDERGVAEGVQTVEWVVLEEEIVSGAVGLLLSLALSCK